MNVDNTILKFFKIFIFCLAVFSAAGCQNWNSIFEKKKNPGIAKEMSTASLLEAEMLRKQGDYRKAMVEYRKFIDAASDEAQRQKGQIGLAQCLIAMHKYTEAINTLKPLPLEPESGYERQVLAIAGEALLRDGSSKEAEGILEIAMDDINNTIYTSDTWRAGASANLACAYLKNDKPQKAILFFGHAAKLYEASGNRIASMKARQMEEDLKSLINQYAPYKPVPLTKDLPSGTN